MVPEIPALLAWALYAAFMAKVQPKFRGAYLWVSGMATGLLLSVAVDALIGMLIGD